jgi:hypothetical protein
LKYFPKTLQRKCHQSVCSSIKISSHRISRYRGVFNSKHELRMALLSSSFQRLLCLLTSRTGVQCKWSKCISVLTESNTK